MRDEDWPAVRDIYEAGIATGNATFETAAPTWERWDAGHLADHRLVATDDDDRWSGGRRSARCRTAASTPASAENSVYVHPDHRGRGVGTDLLDALVAGAERAGYWTIQTGIFPENTASIATHERGRVPHRRPPRTHRPARRRVARHAVPRAAQHPHLTAE